MHGPIATILPDPSGPVTAQPGMYLCDVWAIRSDERTQTEFTTIAEFDALVESGNVGYVMFGHFDFPSRAVRNMAKARDLVVRLLREYEEGMWGRFRSPATEPAPSTIAAVVKRSLPVYTLTEQLEALRREAHTAQRQGLTQVVALLKERACALAESYLDLNCMCDRGHWLNEYGQCETCLEAAQQLACARMHVNETFQRWQFEAQTTDCPF